MDQFNFLKQMNDSQSQCNPLLIPGSSLQSHPFIPWQARVNGTSRFGSKRGLMRLKDFAVIHCILLFTIACEDETRSLGGPERLALHP